MTISLPDHILLTNQIPDYIISLDGVQDEIMKAKIAEVKKIHRLAITPPNGKKGRWNTYYQGDGTKRKRVMAQTENDLYLKLYDLYFPTEIPKLKFGDVYTEWLEYKTAVTNSPNTITRHKQHYAKYFKDSELDKAEIQKIDVLMLNRICNSLIKDNNLTRKEWNNIKTIIKGVFFLATEKKYIREDITLKINITVKFRQISKKSGQTEVFNSAELADFMKYLDQMYTETEDSAFLAIKFNFYMGLRVGELTALRWDDIRDQRLFISRQEITDKAERKTSVVDHTKTYDCRDVLIPQAAMAILDKIDKGDNTWLWQRNGNRITNRQIAYVLEKYCERAGMEKAKSTHKIRKTYASMLDAGGVPRDTIRQLLGHNSLMTTDSYIFNPLTNAETYELIDKALK